jgi:hypothetical protein
MGGFDVFAVLDEDLFKLGLLRHYHPPIRRAFLAMTNKD